MPELEIVHLVPRSRGGPDAKYNYVLTHESTNKIKADRTPFEWLSGNKVKWQAYVDRVRARAKELGAKRCKLLLGENSEELVEKYTALSETAWISKLAQRIACMHFGFQFGGNTGQKRVFTVPGNVTARIRGTFKLNRILNNEDKDRGDMSELDIVKLDYELDKKNRKNKKHHALDAMCLCFAPTGADAKRAKIETLLPPKIASCAEAYFSGYIDKITPVEVGTKKASLEDGIYSKRVIDGKVCIVRRFELKELAYKSVQNKPVYSILALRKLLKKNSKKIQKVNELIGRDMNANGNVIFAIDNFDRATEEAKARMKDPKTNLEVFAKRREIEQRKAMRAKEEAMKTRAQRKEEQRKKPSSPNPNNKARKPKEEERSR